jgi:two-component system phosphate regulon sensor histidine kinase PhoR
MSSRLKLPVALCLLVLLGVALSAAFSLRVGATSLLFTLVGLLLGVLATRNEADRERPLMRQQEPPEVEGRPGGPNGSGAAGALLEATMNGMREGVLVVDGSLRVVSANNAAGSVFGRERVSLAGQPLSVLTRNPAIHAAYRAALERGEDTQVKVELLGTDRRVLELRVSPLELGERNDSRDAIGVFFDITQLERLERVRQEFLSNVSHELRTPLTAIVTFVETLEGGALDEPETARRFVSVIGRNAGRMRTLIEDIMELSSIESGGTKVEARPVRVFHLVQEMLRALAAKADGCGVSLANEVSPEATVYADPRRLEQMLLNLVDNAVKFSRRGGTVTVRHERGERDLLSVSDTGEGIPAEHLPRIFERFYRVDRARSRELGGTGLGLAIVKHLARAHGGEVRVSSAPDEGSTFTIELPPEQQPAAEAV